MYCSMSFYIKKVFTTIIKSDDILFGYSIQLFWNKMEIISRHGSFDKMKEEIYTKKEVLKYFVFELLLVKNYILCSAVTEKWYYIQLLRTQIVCKIGICCVYCTLWFFINTIFLPIMDIESVAQNNKKII